MKFWAKQVGQEKSFDFRMFWIADFEIRYVQLEETIQMLQNVFKKKKSLL